MIFMAFQNDNRMALTNSATQNVTLVPDSAWRATDRIIDEAEALGVFGVPTMVFNGELFWGSNRIDMLIERIGSYIEREGIQAD
jgi:2-hydroxychromene-2-carboxylate isomerase